MPPTSFVRGGLGPDGPEPREETVLGSSAFVPGGPEVEPQVDRSYRIEGLIGSGGFARVYLAEQRGAAGFSKRVAIKLLKIRPDMHPDIEMRLRDEARILARLAHPAIVAVQDLVLINGQWAVVMEYVPGCDLATILRRRVPTPGRRRPARADPPRARARVRGRGGRRAVLRARRAVGAAPGHQAREHPDRGDRQRQGAGLRHRAGGLPGSRGRDGERLLRHPGLHGPPSGSI